VLQSDDTTTPRRDELLTKQHVALGCRDGKDATDARATDGVRIVHTFDASTHDRIIYPLLLLSGSAPAASFHDFLRTPDAMRVFQAHGFAPIAVTTGEAP